MKGCTNFEFSRRHCAAGVGGVVGARMTRPHQTRPLARRAWQMKELRNEEYLYNCREHLSTPLPRWW
jgi:hypothetical protein